MSTSPRGIPCRSDPTAVARCGARLAAAVVALAAAGAAQPLAITTTDGAVLVGVIQGVAGQGRERNLRVRIDGETKSVPVARVLGLHGPAPRPVEDAVVHLVGGDQLRGQLRGGDAAGETFVVQSPSLGELAVPVDRLRAVILPPAREAGPEAFEIPADADHAEALFRTARRGFDTILGAIHRFTPRGVLFEWSEASAPELFSYEQLAAIALRDGVPRDGVPGALLVTRAGDVLGVDLLGVEDDRFVFELDGERTVRVPMAELSALAFLGDDRRYLSDLEPTAVVERGTPFEDEAPPLYPYRRDRTATGGFLVAGGWTHAKGLGTHGRCALTFTVPEGFRSLHAKVGIDDSVLQTPVRGAAEARVELEGKVVFGPATVRGGEPPQSVGPIRVEAGQVLTLQVEFGEGWFLGDRVDWLSAVLLR